MTHNPPPAANVREAIRATAYMPSDGESAKCDIQLRMRTPMTNHMVIRMAVSRPTTVCT